MSSPLSMLKKTRRTPLQDPQKEPSDRQKVSFRRNPLKEFQADVAEDEGGFSSSKPDTPSKKAAAPTDFELMSAMMRRVTLLERKVLSQEQELERKDEVISALREELMAREKSGRTWELEKRCQQLQNQVCDMESFLCDYGLIWVGDEETIDSAEIQQPQETVRGLRQPDSPEVTSFQMNFDLLLQRIRELNILAGEGECFVQSTATGAQLAKKEPIQLSLYSNGIVMFDGPFRSYQEHSTQQCMQDLMDGYFPSELQERFPDGVPFEVHDRREEEFVFRPPWSQFPGEGRAVCEEKGKKLRLDQFLNQMPRMVIKSGRVISIRDSLRDALQGSCDAQSSSSSSSNSSSSSSSSSLILIDTPALQALKERQPSSSLDRPASAGDIIMLKVRSEDGSQTFVLKMSVWETVAHLRQHLDKHRGEGLPGYDIISMYPQCCYDDDCRTLQSCGLRTNMTLLLRKRQKPQINQ